MKKTYAAPTLVTSGNVVLETLNGSQPTSAEVFLKPIGSGSVGFYL
jgi:hypothetical protein